MLKNVEKINVKLKGCESEIITFAEIKDGFAVIGITGKINCGGVIEKIEKTASGYEIRVKTSGNLKLYSEKKVDIYIDDLKVDCERKDGIIDIMIENSASVITVR